MKDTALEKMTVKELNELKRRVESMIIVKQDKERIEVRDIKGFHCRFGSCLHSRHSGIYC